MKLHTYPSKIFSAYFTTAEDKNSIQVVLTNEHGGRALFPAFQKEQSTDSFFPTEYWRNLWHQIGEPAMAYLPLENTINYLRVETPLVFWITERRTKDGLALLNLLPVEKSDEPEV